VRFLFIGELGYPVISTSYLERTCYLEIFRFKENVAVRVYLGCSDTGGRSDDFFQYI
jgi:hypothetical protein